MPLFRFFSLVLAASLVFAKAEAQPIPAPQTLVPGHTERFTPHHRLLDYFETVAKASPRVQLTPYGETYEGRPLVAAFVSSPENLANLSSLRENHLRRLGLLDGEASGKSVAVVWLSYSVHGNEAAGSEASLTVLHQLAAAEPETPLASYLENTLVILDPSLNPDGYTRYTDDQRRRATRYPDAAPSAWEHEEPWPGGRTNHYLFDLNRDWAWASQAETRQRLTLYHQWMPHVHADVHEMSANSSYYFPPAAEPFHTYITPFQRDFQTEVGRNHARVFDREGWLYYTREQFDLLYPSYGDTYPTFNGAVGMTYEQAGSGRAGRAYRREEGDTLTLADRIEHHVATSLSTIATASQGAKTLVQEGQAYRRMARESSRGSYEAYVFPQGDNTTGKLLALTNMLDVHGISYGYAAQNTSVDGRSFGELQARKQTVTAQALVVPARQSQGVLAQVLLDPDVELRDSLTYDITAWNLPLVYGIRGFASLKAVALAPASAPTKPSQTQPTPDYGFAVTLRDLTTWQRLTPLLRQGAVARYTPRSVVFEGQQFAPGTLFFLRRDQSSPSAFAKTYRDLTADGVAEVKILTSGFSSDGTDLGSDAVRQVKAPTVALLQSEHASSNAFGHVWHFFEQQLDYPIRPIPEDAVSARSLAEVDVLIVADGSYDFSGPLGKAVTTWVRGGGRLIAMEGGAVSVRREDAYALSDKEAPATLRSASDNAKALAPYGSTERAALADNLPGALIETALDRSHPLLFGVQPPFYTVRTDHRPWAYLERGFNVITIPEAPHIKGFVGSALKAELDESLVLGIQPLGRGEVVYAADNLAYRGFWRHGMHVLTNAVFFR